MVTVKIFYIENIRLVGVLKGTAKIFAGIKIQGINLKKQIKIATEILLLCLKIGIQVSKSRKS